MYCYQADITEQISVDELIQLTDDNGLGMVDASVLDRAVADAQAEIDSYCGTRYTVPFSAVPDMIRKVAVDISIYNLYARRRGAPEDRKERYRDAIRFLKGVASGGASLGASAPQATDDSGPQTTKTPADRIFTRGRVSDGSSGSLDNY